MSMTAEKMAAERAAVVAQAQAKLQAGDLYTKNVVLWGANPPDGWRIVTKSPEPRGYPDGNRAYDVGMRPSSGALVLVKEDWGDIYFKQLFAVVQGEQVQFYEVGGSSKGMFHDWITPIGV